MSPADGTEEFAPDFRVTYLRHELRVIRWNQSMATARHLEESLSQDVRFGTYEPVLFDLFLMAGDDRQIAVSRYGNSDRFEEAESALVSWAGDAGYARVWMNADCEFVDLAPTVDRAEAEVHCPCCSMIYEWDEASFWDQITRDGFLERQCPTCGTQLPQWTFEGEEAREAEATKEAVEFLKDLFRPD